MQFRLNSYFRGEYGALVELCILVFIYTFLLPKEQTDEGWEPSKKQSSFSNCEALDIK
jgi:hypothetical protein